MNIFVLYFLCCNMQATPYYVCHIDGKVQFAASKDSVKLGDKIQEKDSLLFTGAGARVVVVSNKGVFNITNRKTLPGQPLANVVLVVRDHILPDNKIVQLHTKGSGALINLQAMQSYLASLSDEDKPKLLLVNNIRFYLNRQTFAERNKNYFFLRYQYKDETIQQKLPYTEPQQANGPLYVEINKSIFQKNNTLLDTANIKDMQLYYQFGDTPAPVLISDLAIVMASREALLNELKIVIRHLVEINASQDERKETLQKLIAGYLQRNYGGTDTEELSVLFPELFE
jgi:hypothetical protein